ncbi:hypothetical protein OHA42_38175 [Nocardia sp. NBC_01009]|nr:hypothetical protein OHA42_38175 [Nocardia sp. NBC_01009]
MVELVALGGDEHRYCAGQKQRQRSDTEQLRRVLQSGSAQVPAGVRPPQFSECPQRRAHTAGDGSRGWYHPAARIGTPPHSGAVGADLPMAEQVGARQIDQQGKKGRQRQIAGIDSQFRGRSDGVGSREQLQRRNND